MWNPRENFLFSEEEYSLAKSHHYLPIKCLHCGGIGRVKKGVIKRIMEGKSLRSGLYCSKSCQGSSIVRKKKRITMICGYCGDKFDVFPYKAKRGKGQKYWFCSNNCRLKALSELMTKVES